MKRSLIIIAVLALAACASPRDAKIKDGEISGITSAEATTLAKVDQRQKKVESVQKNAKPILSIKGHPGKPITIDAETFEVNVPIDPAILLAEQPSEVSENVQIIQEIRGIARETVVPVAGAVILANDRKDARQSAERVAATNAQAAKEAAAAQATQNAAYLAAIEAANQRAAAAASPATPAAIP